LLGILNWSTKPNLRFMAPSSRVPKHPSFNIFKKINRCGMVGHLRLERNEFLGFCP
jgi:hypothetical protein